MLPTEQLLCLGQNSSIWWKAKGCPCCKGSRQPLAAPRRPLPAPSAMKLPACKGLSAPTGGTQLAPPQGASCWRHFKQGFPAQHLWHVPSFSRNVAKRYLWRCQYLLSAYRGNLQLASWTRYITLIWLQRDEMNLGHILPFLITLWLT